MKKKIFQAVSVFIASCGVFGYMTFDGIVTKFCLLVALVMLTIALTLSLASN